MRMLPTSRDIPSGPAPARPRRDQHRALGNANPRSVDDCRRFGQLAPGVGRASRMRAAALTVAALLAAPALAAAADVPVACPSDSVRVVRSAGGVIDYLGSVPGIPELCRMQRTGDGPGDFYFGIWRSDWPGAGEAYLALWAVIHAAAGARTTFITRSWPGLQWVDSFTNGGIEIVTAGGTAHRALRIDHEREGIEGNTYHSIITLWKDLVTGVTLKVVETQISGRSYGLDTTWQATRLEPLP
jgi:hypothetical protein